MSQEPEHLEMKSSPSMDSKSRKRLLLVAYAFPPVGGVGVQRALKFVKYLPEFNWDVTVLTAANASVPLRDEKLCAEIPSETTVITAKTLEPAYEKKQALSGSHQAGHSIASQVKSYIKKILRTGVNMLIQPDLQVLWNRDAIKTGLKQLKQVKHDAIMVTAPPFSSFLIGCELARRTGLPLILDYRDEWGISNQYWENKQQDSLSRWRQTRLEQRILKQAQLVLATTPSSAQSLQTNIIKIQARSQVGYIYNGYDPADFVLPAEKSTRPDYGHGTHLYRLSYVGTLWNLNRVQPLVDAVKTLCENSPVLASQLEIVIAGRKTTAEEAVLDQLQNLPCKLVKLPFVDHQEAIRLMKTSDGLVLLNSNVQHAERIVSGKAFEYIAAEKTVFIVSPKGDMWELFADCPFAHPCPPDKPEILCEKMSLELERFRMKLSLPVTNWDPQVHSRKSRAGLLANMLEHICKNYPPERRGFK